MHTDADRAAYVQPSAGCRGPVNVPPTVARFDTAVCRARHRVERPRLVRMSAVHRAQGRSLDLSEQAALMMMRIAGRLGARCSRKVQVAAVLRRGRRAGSHRRSRVAAGRAAGAARRRRSLTDSGRCASTSSSTPAPSPSPTSSASAATASSGVLRRAATALRTLLPRMETFAHRCVGQRRWTLAAQFVALSREHRQRCTS